jgi:hypothetical protein
VAKCNINKSNIYPLIKIAGEFGVKSFERNVTDFFKPILDENLIFPKVLFKYLILFDKYNYIELKEKSISLLASKTQLINETKLWTALFVNHNELVTEIMLKIQEFVIEK